MSITLNVTFFTPPCHSQSIECCWPSIVFYLIFLGVRCWQVNEEFFDCFCRVSCSVIPEMVQTKFNLILCVTELLIYNSMPVRKEIFSNSSFRARFSLPVILSKVIALFRAKLIFFNLGFRRALKFKVIIKKNKKKLTYSVVQFRGK